MNNKFTVIRFAIILILCTLLNVHYSIAGDSIFTAIDINLPLKSGADLSGKYVIKTSDNEYLSDYLTGKNDSAVTTVDNSYYAFYFVRQPDSSYTINYGNLQAVYDDNTNLQFKKTGTSIHNTWYINVVDKNIISIQRGDSSNNFLYVGNFVGQNKLYTNYQNAFAQFSLQSVTHSVALHKNVKLLYSVADKPLDENTLGGVYYVIKTIYGRYMGTENASVGDPTTTSTSDPNNAISLIPLGDNNYQITSGDYSASYYFSPWNMSFDRVPFASKNNSWKIHVIYGNTITIQRSSNENNFIKSELNYGLEKFFTDGITDYNIHFKLQTIVDTINTQSALEDSIKSALFLYNNSNAPDFTDISKDIFLGKINTAINVRDITYSTKYDRAQAIYALNDAVSTFKLSVKDPALFIYSVKDIDIIPGFINGKFIIQSTQDHYLASGKKSAISTSVPIYAFDFVKQNDGSYTINWGKNQAIFENLSTRTIMFTNGILGINTWLIKVIEKNIVTIQCNDGSGKYLMMSSDGKFYTIGTETDLIKFKLQTPDTKTPLNLPVVSVNNPKSVKLNATDISGSYIIKTYTGKYMSCENGPIIGEFDNALNGNYENGIRAIDNPSYIFTFEKISGNLYHIKSGDFELNSNDYSLLYVDPFPYKNIWEVVIENNNIVSLINSDNGRRMTYKNGEFLTNGLESENSLFELIPQYNAVIKTYNTVFCSGVNFNITEGIDNIISTSWNWDFGPDATPSTSNVKGPVAVNYSISGIKNIKLTVNGNYTVNKHITIISTPEKPTIVADYTNLKSSAIVGNQWYKSNNQIIGAVNNTFKAIEDGYYKVKVTENGCVSSYSDSIKILTTSINTLKLGNHTEAYPNPNSTGIFTLHSDNLYNKVQSIYVYNNSGQLFFIKSLKFIDGVSELNLSELSSGIYNLKIGNNTEIIKLVIKK